MSTPELTYHQKWYLQNKERIKANYLANHDEQLKRQKASYRKRYSDPEKRKQILAQNREYLKAHPEVGRKNALRYRNKDPELARKTHKAWRESPAGRKWYQARDHNRRAAKLGVTINPRSIQIFIDGVRDKKTVICYYCEEKTSGASAHIDHIIPLSKGGPHSIENLCVSCPKCNQTKINKPIQEWMRLGQQILSL